MKTERLVAVKKEKGVQEEMVRERERTDANTVMQD